METTEQKKTRVGPLQFLREVKQEISRVTWPTRKETLISGIMVVVMVIIAAIFFLIVDGVISYIVRLILGY